MLSVDEMPQVSREPTYENLRFFCRKGRSFLVNTQSVSIYDVSRIAADVVAAGIPYARAPFADDALPVPVVVPAEAASGPARAREIRRLLETMNTEGVEETRNDIRMGRDLTEEKLPTPSALTIYPTNYCNLRCSYCYNHAFCASSPPTAARPDQPAQPKAAPVVHMDSGIHVMSRATADKALDHLFSNDNKTLHISFFGGEPMLGFGIMKYVVEQSEQRARRESRTMSFHMTTNGTVVDDRQIAFFEEHAFTLLISCDGVKEMHDRHRPWLQTGQGSFDVILDNILRKWAPCKLQKAIRATAPLEELDFDRMGRALVEYGLLHFSVEPAFAMMDDHDPRAMRQALASLERWAETYVKLNETQFVDFYYFVNAIWRMMTKRPTLRPCQAGYHQHAVATDGTLWPCHVYVGHPDTQWILGTVDSGITRPDLVERFRRLTIRERTWCKDCWAGLFCGGMCIAPTSADQIYRPGHEYFRPSKAHCAFWQEALQISSWVYAEMLERCPRILYRILHREPQPELSS